MSAVTDAIAAIRDVMKMADDVKQVGESLKGVAAELRDHDRRITRLEAKWETAMELAGIRSSRVSQLDGEE